MREIQSAQNPHFKLWKTLLEPKGIKKQKQCLIAGRKIVPETLTDAKIRVREIITDNTELLAELPRLGQTPVYVLPSRLFRELDEFGTHFPLVVAETPELPEWQSDTPFQGLQLVCGLGNPLNVGALLRSAEAFGVQQVVLLRESAHPFHPKSIRASSGSALRVNLALGPSLKEIDASKWIALDKNGEDLSNFSWPASARLILGEEGQGLPSELLDQTQRVRIPMQGRVESLNVLAAATVALYTYSLQHNHN